MRGPLSLNKVESRCCRLMTPETRAAQGTGLDARENSAHRASRQPFCVRSLPPGLQPRRRGPGSCPLGARRPQPAAPFPGAGGESRCPSGVENQGAPGLWTRAQAPERFAAVAKKPDPPTQPVGPVIPPWAERMGRGASCLPGCTAHRCCSVDSSPLPLENAQVSFSPVFWLYKNSRAILFLQSTQHNPDKSAGF